MGDMKHLESLQPGQAMKELGSSHAANIGFGEPRDLRPDDVKQMFGPARTPLQQFEAAGMVERSKTEMGGGPDGGLEQFYQLLQMFQSQEALDVTAQAARVAGVEGALMARGWRASQAAELIKDRKIKFPNLPQPITLTWLAGAQQVVTTSAKPEHFQGENGTLSQEGGWIPEPDFGRRVAISPPQLVRELVVESHEKGEGNGIVLRPYLPAKLEPFADFVATGDPNMPKDYSLASEESSRLQIANHLAMILLGRGLFNSLSSDDRMVVQKVFDRLQASSHDEVPLSKILALVPEITPTLVGDEIKALSQLYVKHLTDRRIWSGVRTIGVGISMWLEKDLGDGQTSRQEVTGLVGMGDFMDAILESQQAVELIQQKHTDSGPRELLTGVSPLMQRQGAENTGVVLAEAQLITKVIGEKLGYFNEVGDWVYLKGLQDQGFKIARTNLPDFETMTALTKESAGKYPLEGWMVVSSMYPLYYCAREFSRALLLDMMVSPEFSPDSGKETRKLRRWVYDVWTYWQGKTGLNELQKTYPYKDIISEKLIPFIIDLVKCEESSGWKGDLKQQVKADGGVWLGAWDSYQSITSLQKDVIAKVLTKPTILASRLPVVEGYVNALALSTSSTTRQQKIDAYRAYIDKDFVKSGGMSLKEADRREAEFIGLINYWSNGGNFSKEYDSDRGTGRVPQNWALEDWLKHKITNELYGSKSQRPGTLRTKEEMDFALNTLTSAETSALNFGDVNFASLAAEMGVTFHNSQGASGLESLVKNFKWRNLPVDGTFRAIDATSVGGYIADFVALTGETSKFNRQIGTPNQAESVGQFPVTGDNIDTGQIFGLIKTVSEYLEGTYQFVPMTHQRERALEFLKVLLWATTPLNENELVSATMNVVPKNSTQPTHQEMFIPISLFGPNEREWLSGNAIRGHTGGGKKGMIFLSDFPVRFRLKFRDIKTLFRDMSDDLSKIKSQHPTIIGLERPDYNTVPWGEVVKFFETTSVGNTLLTPEDAKGLRKFAELHLSPKHKNTSETTPQSTRRLTMDFSEILKGIFDALPK